MATLLIYPGQKTDLVDLQAVLHESHEASRAAIQKEIDLRKAGGIPLDDKTNWTTLREHLTALTAAVEGEQTGDVEAAARKIVGGVNGHVLKPLAEYKPNPDLDGIRLIFKMVSEAQRRDWSSRITARSIEMGAASHRGDLVDMHRARGERDDVVAERLAACIAEIHGLEGMKGGPGSVAESMEAIRLDEELFWSLSQAVVHFLELPPGKAMRCGRLPPSTSTP